MLVQKFNYKAITRKNINNKRHYITPMGDPVASVTTILSKTKPKKDLQKLLDWKKRTDERYGAGTAASITKEAADRGTNMHTYLEEYCKTDSIENIIKRQQKPREAILKSQGYNMANVVINNGLKYLDECWSVEVPVYIPELYAGTTDCVGIFEGNPSIVDFKQTNKPKKREWIDEYFMQLCAYAEAHNELHKTNIKHGVILMCSQNLEFQRFDISGDEFEKYRVMWWDRVEQYYTDLYK